ncbi:MAG: hypothetical protein JNK05_31155 [Myxococcales bacterium]|nr:hypothetical protein [Myxococcales bacterium]
MVFDRSSMGVVSVGLALSALGCAPLPEEEPREALRAVAIGSGTAASTLDADGLRLYVATDSEIAVRGALPQGAVRARLALERYGRVLSTFEVSAWTLPARWFAPVDDLRAIRRFRVTYFDSAGRSLPDRWQWFRDTAVAAEGASCDPTGVETRCASPTYCAESGREPQCSVMQPVPIAEARSWTRGAELRSFARVEGARQPALEWRLVAGGVELRPWSASSLTQRVEAGGLNTWALVGSAVPADAVVEWRTKMRVPGTTLDVLGPTASAARSAGASAGTPCPYAGEVSAAELCDTGLRCAADAGGRFACRAVPERCTEGLPQFDEIPAMAEGASSTIEVVPTGYTRNCITSCNQRATVTGAFRFVAPRAGRYTFRWAPRVFGAYLAPIALRYSCRTYDYESTEVCIAAEGEQRGVGARTMTAGEEILVMPFERNGAGTLTVTAE